MTTGDLPGLARLRPDDHFMILSETDASPMHVGALLLFDAVPAGFAETIRRQVSERLPATPLLARLVEAPEGYDSDVWADVAACDLDYHLTRVSQPLDPVALRAAVADLSMERLDLARAPFRGFVFDALPGGAGAVYLKVHHAVADGIGFQEILRRLSDAEPPPPPRPADAALPDAETWRAAADARFAALAPEAAAHSAQRREALAALDALKQDPASARARTPVLKMSGPTSPQRSLATVSLPLARVKAVAAALGGTINDIFLAIAATAIRETLLEIGDLPETPVVVNSARSYRRPEHGAFGNRIVALHPHVATHLADPVERLRAIQASMALERARTHLDEAMLGAPEKPNGARDRRAKFAERTADGGRLLPGNVTLSNVPGPAEALSFAGLTLAANYPVPIIGSGRFLNITSRRSGAMLDMGVMSDASRLPDARPIGARVAAALDLYEGLALG
ncbi:wax ester/triacylglycerol synthase domain-containing protein [Sphingomonas immobilis]|uniref:diacylglycerol O-acyltransferase n=1 Tax=Sphingomonas immobilis TaxID=3063997 RepID=A0ABT8ZXK2_9SPHN|nr:wax ester/triacylglycerol synthase domain-containing protein [Sphingomonas sp. CA1-15]MDO7842294.1 wax ester/triacylglycerol synthase family O-acyltransferase [Sphingomonas sp. CA1-15]